MPKIGIGNIMPDIANLPGQGSGGGGGGGFTNTKSLLFDGVDDYVDTGITNTGTNDISVSCWIKTTETFSYTVSRCAFGGRSNIGGTNYTLGRLGSGFATPDDMVVRLNNTYGTTKLNDGDWHNIVYTYNFTTKEVKAYVDGNTTAEATITFAPWNTNYQIAIGWNGFDTSYYFEGNVDECAYFTRVLGASDITEIYNSGAPGDISGMSDLISWWRMGENATFKEPQILMPENTNKDKASNYSMEFDGVNDYVDVGTTASMTDISISFWMKAGTPPAYAKNIIGGNTNSIFQYLGSKDTSLDLYVYYSAVGWAKVATNVFDNAWHHIVVTFDNSTGETKGYKNGALDSTATITGLIGTSAHIGRIGSYITSSRYYTGNADEVSLYNTILDSTAVSTIYNSGVPSDLTGTSGLTNWWRMGEEAIFDPAATEWTISDQAGSNTGTSANMTIEDRTGDAPDSPNNALSYNMDADAIVEDTPPNP